MKKFILAFAAVSMVATPVLAAPQHHSQSQRTQVTKGKTVVKHQPGGRVVVQQPMAKKAPVQYRNWKKGQRFDSRYARNYRQVDYRQHRNLKAPPRGYHYVQSGNDAVLVAVTTGLIAAVFANILR